VSHVVLLGDSVFDNAAYVAAGPDVTTQLRGVLPPGWTATLLAVDGAIISEVPSQLKRLPRDATQLVLSAGGNDALAHTDLLDRRASSSAQVLGWIADAAEEFEERYRRLLATLVGRRLPLTVCTIYNGNLQPPVRRIAATALSVFNDAILRVAAEHSVRVIELRLVCTEPRDYANPIEPSVLGGEKIARAIAAAATGTKPR
jgi:hypothetical protein